MCLDRAGLVGSDGKTHQGVFDISYLKHVPNLTILAPKDVCEFNKMMVAVANYDMPVAIRYPNGIVKQINSTNEFTLNLKWEELTKGENVVIFATGARMVELALEVNNRLDKKVTVINARVIKPLDVNTIKNYLNCKQNMTTFEFV